jgi:hypothetical protein
MRLFGLKRLFRCVTIFAGFSVVAGLLSVGVASAASTSPALFDRTTLGYSSTLSTSQEASRYQVMVLQPSDAKEVVALHVANPSLKIFMYSNALYARSSDPTGVETCTGYASDNASDPNWFLENQNGDRIATEPGSLMDMGNTAYQQACVSHAIALAKQDGFDGIMFDGLSSGYSWLAPSGTVIKNYPTTASWDAAMQSFVNYAGKTVQAANLMVMGDLAGTSLSQWEQWTAPLTGSEQQAWTDGGQGEMQQLPYWPTKLAEVAWSEAHGKLTILDSHNKTEAGNAYGLASMLLVANGNTSYGTNNANNASYEEWYPGYTTAEQLGAPAGAYTKLSNGVYEREFANGIVVVNPTSVTKPAVALGGSYEDDSTDVTTASLTAGSGEILLNKTSGPSPALFNRTAYVYESNLSAAQEASRYQVIILTATDASEVAALHAANPDLVILMYSMALYSNSNDPDALETCVSYANATESDSSWFLLNQNGQRMNARNGADWAMDMGNTAYQKSCVSHTIALAKQDGFNGVFFDGLNSFWQGFVPSSSTVPEYPTESSWQTAMQQFLNYAGQTIQASGLLAAANLSGASSPTLWDEWSAPLNGSQEQSFTDGGLGLAQQVPDWKSELTNAAWNESHQKYAIYDSYNKTEAGNTYGLASLLLVANGYSSWSTSNSDDTDSGETWYPEYTDAQQLGSATGAYTQLSNGVYERRFQNGIVLVNPTTSSVSTFSLGGTYSGATTSSTSSVSLPATSGLILLKSS